MLLLLPFCVQCILGNLGNAVLTDGILVIYLVCSM